MKGAICYYSGTGNTKLACAYIADRIGVPFELIDVAKVREVDLVPYDVVGLATFADGAGPPQLFLTFVEELAQQAGKPAFVFNTYGAVSGKTLRLLEGAATDKGFRVFAGHSLHTPESYPPMIARGMGAEGAPNRKEMGRFDAFVSDLGRSLNGAGEGDSGGPGRVRIGLFNGLLPTRQRTWARDDMGEKHVDEDLCTECGTCERGCPYAAIRLDPKPVFDQRRCYGCWRCYNRCPEQAIYTDRFRGGPFYPGPNDHVRQALHV
jgi:NAD-dependent dihydropyrimidine dehydrogenase PreA subunit/flavodoxin